MDQILEKLEQIQHLRKILGKTTQNSREYDALVEKIRVLSREYNALLDAPKKPLGS